MGRRTNAWKKARRCRLADGMRRFCRTFAEHSQAVQLSTIFHSSYGRPFLACAGERYVLDIAHEWAFAFTMGEIFCALPSGVIARAVQSATAAAKGVASSSGICRRAIDASPRSAMTTPSLHNTEKFTAETSVVRAAADREEAESCNRPISRGCRG